MTLEAVGRAWQNGSRGPYLMLLASPLLTLPISGFVLKGLPDCGDDEPWWKLQDFELALLPGLVDFAPFLWMLSRTPVVRRAGMIAGLIGSARYAIPQALTLWYSVSFGEQTLNPGCSVSSFFMAGLGPIILGLWAASAVLVLLVLGQRPTDSAK